MNRFWLCAVAAAALSARAAAADVGQAPHFGAWGVDLSGRDLSVTPGNDFFRYADGAAVDKVVIPPDHTRFGTLNVLDDLSETRSRQAIETARTAPGADARKLVALYDSFMDEAQLETLGAKPLQGELAAIRASRSRADLARLMGRSAKSLQGTWFGLSISDDAKAPLRYAVILDQAGLGLPDRDYYLTPQFAAQKAKYQTHIADTLVRIGWPEAQARAGDIVALETSIAEVSWTRVQRRDDNKTYHPFTVSELTRAAPGFPWRAYLQAADLGQVRRVIVSEDTAFPQMAALYARTPIAVLKAWAAYTLTDNASPYLSKAFDQAHFAFHSTALSGVPEQKARWKRAVTLVGDKMGEALGRLYVAAYFPPEAKAKMLALVADVRAALGERLKRVDWMSEDTKQKALEKLAKLNVKIGYPDKWRDYSKLTVRAGDLYGNVERGQAFDWAFRVGRLNRPVDRGEWDMTPQTVNAYYELTKNEIVFPAAILQPPFFDPAADPAVNYGAIGGVIGHEMTHGFDDQGRKSDGDGVLRDWWTQQDADRFDARAAGLAKQYSAFEPLPGAHINGQLTLGENIADLGGMLLALDAYHASLRGQPAPVVDGLTGDQRVFLGWAQAWRSKTRPDAERRQLAVDPHSPEIWRVDGVMRNVDAWYQAWNVKPGDALYVAPNQRVRIW